MKVERPGSSGGWRACSREYNGGRFASQTLSVGFLPLPHDHHIDDPALGGICPAVERLHDFEVRLRGRRGLVPDLLGDDEVRRPLLGRGGSEEGVMTLRADRATLVEG